MVADKVGNVKIDSIKLLLKKAEEFHSLALEIGIDTGLIEAIAGDSVIVEPYYIIELVQRKLNVDITKVSRKKDIVDARRIAAWLLQKYARLSLKKIMVYVNLKDHSTVLHHIRLLDGYLEHDEYLQHVVSSLESDIIGFYNMKKYK